MTIYRTIGILAMAWIMAGGPLSGCAGPGFFPVVEEARRDPPASYVVVRGDTLYGIAWRYGLDYRRVADWNRLANPNLIYPGQRLRLRPPQDRPQPYAQPPITLQGRSMAEPPQTPSMAGASPSPAHQDRPIEAPRETGPLASRSTPSAVVPAREKEAKPDSVRKVGQLVWRWPTQGKIVRRYQPDIPGRRGIHIGGQSGQVIRAASPGQVVYSGNGLPGYGRLIIVKHSDILLSAYGYLGRILVKEGDDVDVGQPIAEMGANNENHPALHFEIRQNGKPVDPLQFLPG